MGAESVLRPQQVVHNKARGVTGVLDMNGKRESEDFKLSYLLCWPIGFSGKFGWWVPRHCLLELGIRQ